MTDAEHFRKLEQLYAAAPISQWYGATAAIADGHAEVRFAIRPEFLHAAHAVHGSVYFRALTSEPRNSWSHSKLVDGR
jgi:acyl-coenzyme A thioesterase PaaI-like protein